MLDDVRETFKRHEQARVAACVVQVEARAYNELAIPSSGEREYTEWERFESYDAAFAKFKEYSHIEIHVMGHGAATKLAEVAQKRVANLLREEFFRNRSAS